MAAPHPVEPALPIASVFSAFPAAIGEVRVRLLARLGPILRELGPFPFTQTDHYAAEMGPILMRSLFAFDRAFDPIRLPETKLWTNEVEGSFRGRPEYPVPRPVNVDPGYLTRAKLVLASAKDFSHRLYLGQGIYGEVTLFFRHGRFESWPWTYPDYASEPYRRFFEEVRGLLAGRERS